MCLCVMLVWSIRSLKNIVSVLLGRLVGSDVSPKVFLIGCIKYNSCAFPPTLSTFALATELEVKAAILSMSDSTCSLDSLTTKLVKSCLDALLLPITHIINLCLKESKIPADFKHALIFPTLKKDSAKGRPLKLPSYI